MGFGIRTAGHAARIARIADAAVVGSAFCEAVADGIDEETGPTQACVENVAGPVPRVLRGGQERPRMNWLSNLSLPKIRDLVGKTQTQETLWDKCPSCDR